MKKETEEKLSRSLTAETTELIPFLPYLLQDLWELGSDPKEMIRLIKKHVPISSGTKLLDIACGKGAVSINAAKELNVNVYGFDLIKDFIDYAKNKAQELSVGDLCHFTVADVNDVVNNEANYDCVIFGAAGNILGTPEETLKKLCGTIKQGGFILIDECYLPDDTNDVTNGATKNEKIEYKNYEYLRREQWLQLFADSGLLLVEEAINQEHDYENDKNAMTARAAELSAKHPEKEAMFAGYIQSQLNEYSDLENNLVGVTWLLQKRSLL